MNNGTIDIEGVIGWEVTARDVKRQLKEMGDVEEIDVFMNSPGGYIDDGFGTFTALKNHPAKINMHITGMAASMGSVIAMAGDTVTIEPTGMMMVHPPASIAWGTAAEMRKEADVLDKYESRIITAYKRRDLNMTNDELKEAVADETWYTAQEALDAGFVDSISDGESEEQEPTNSVLEWLRVAKYKNAPQSIAKKIKTNRVKSNKLTKELISNDGSAVQTHEEGTNMTDEKTYSEAELKAEVNKAVDAANAESQDSVAVALLSEEGATIESVKAAMDMGLDAEQAKKFMAYAKNAPAAEVVETETVVETEAGTATPELQKMVAQLLANSDVNNVNKNSGSDDDKTKPAEDPVAILKAVKGSNRELV